MGLWIFPGKITALMCNNVNLIEKKNAESTLKTEICILVHILEKI